MSAGRNKRRKYKKWLKVRKKQLRLFVDGSILTAEKLNQLVHQINKLNGYREKYEVRK